MRGPLLEEYESIDACTTFLSKKLKQMKLEMRSMVEEESVRKPVADAKGKNRKRSEASCSKGTTIESSEASKKAKESKSREDKKKKEK